MSRDKFIETILSAPDLRARTVLIESHPEFLNLDIVYALKEYADRSERDDARQALTIGQIGAEIAEQLDQDEARALAQWIQANAYDLLNELDSAVECYEQAAKLFRAAGKDAESARTGIGQMFALMKLGRFEQALSLANAIRDVFDRHQDTLALAKVDMNLGNIHYQQGQYNLALEAFERATASFLALGDTLYGAMNQINQANALILLDDFRRAEQLHEQARPVFESADLRTVAASVDHDLALLQYSRGYYTEAFRTFERARDAFTELALDVNLAMTDLEESDIYLDLNLPEETLRLAQQAEQTFAAKGMNFELARARTNQAIALARLNQQEKALQLLDDARTLFDSQDNQAWSANIDLQQAEIKGATGQRESARHLAAKAGITYEKLGMKTKQAYAFILAANLWADEQAWQSGLQELQSARSTLGELTVPWLEQRIATCLGRIYEGQGDLKQASTNYQKAVNYIEQMTVSLTAEEQRTAFVADKLAPYEALVALHGPDDPASAFQWAEQAKSRALIDLLAAGIRPRLHIAEESDARQAKRLQELRDELNWLYTRLTRGANPGESGAPAAGPETWAKIQEREREATSLWRSLRVRHAEELSLMRTAPVDLAEVQARLPENTAVIEYFVARGQVLAFVINQQKISYLPGIAPLDELLALMENLTFQFSKFQYGTAYYQRHRAALLNATQTSLAQLYQRLIAPLQAEFAGVEALVIIPHGPLHALPFQALRGKDEHLIEKYAISYAPSAAVLKYCWDKPGPDNPGKPFSGKALLVGVPDERASHVSEEIRALQNLIGDAEVLLEQQASFEQVRRSAAESGLFHLAAHGLFRPEAPLLSSIRLADRWLAVQDVYDLELQAELVVLSACETGLGHDTGGDDLVGLVRGFLYAGAASLAVSLWTVDDVAMTELVVQFYTHWLDGQGKARALQLAQQALIQKYEHPFYWAPLVLVGNER